MLEHTLEIAGVGSEYPVVHAPARPGEENMRELFDCSKARSVLGFEPKVGPREAIERTWEYVKADLVERATVAIGK